MPVFHYLHLRAFAHHTEDADRVREAVRRVVQDERLPLEEAHAEGSHGNRILILQAQAVRAAHERALFGQLCRDDAQGAKRLRGELDARLDDDLGIHFRLDKQAAYGGRVVLAQAEDTIVVRGKLRVFRQVAGSREAAFDGLQGLLTP